MSAVGTVPADSLTCPCKTVWAMRGRGGPEDGSHEELRKVGGKAAKEFHPSRRYAPRGWVLRQIDHTALIQLRFFRIRAEGGNQRALHVVELVTRMSRESHVWSNRICLEIHVAVYFPE